MNYIVMVVTETEKNTGEVSFYNRAEWTFDPPLPIEQDDIGEMGAVAERVVIANWEQYDYFED